MNRAQSHGRYDPCPETLPRVRFEDLITDGRQFRGDCRLLTTCVRRGWLAGASEEVKDDVLIRFMDGCQGFSAPEPVSVNQETRFAGAMLKLINAIVAAEGRHRNALHRYVRGKRATGRLAFRQSADKAAQSLDAKAIAGSAVASRVDPARLSDLKVEFPTPEGIRPQRIEIAHEQGAGRGRRTWLVCPRCGKRWTKLNSIRA